jgi:hypothetical protein
MNLLSFIEAAFSDRSAPSHVVNDNAPETDIYDDARTFAGKAWQEVTCDDWSSHPDAVHGFSPEAFCYFLPGIYCAGIRENRPNLLVNDSLVMTLDRANSAGSWDEFFVARWTLLRDVECEATQRWLLWISDFDPSPIADSCLSRAFDTIALLRNRIHATPLAGRFRPRKR